MATSIGFPGVKEGGQTLSRAWQGIQGRALARGDSREQDGRKDTAGRLLGLQQGSNPFTGANRSEQLRGPASKNRPPTQERAAVQPRWAAALVRPAATAYPSRSRSTTFGRSETASCMALLRCRCIAYLRNSACRTRREGRAAYLEGEDGPRTGMAGVNAQCMERHVCPLFHESYFRRLDEEPHQALSRLGDRDHHRPSSGSVDLPAWTLEFDISVVGMQVTHNAQAKQVLEPDGSGGVKTQTFTVLPSRLGPGG
jgi:hypothetical protein